MRPAPEDLCDSLAGADFRAWYREREHRRNARDGNFQWNTPADPPAPAVHRPHTFLTCHRKQRYREENAPGEIPTPAGRFWIGSRIEEELVLEYLTALAPDEAVVGNSLWIDAAIETPREDLRLRGSTDPVFATRNGTPLLPTEVKTKRSVETVDEPAEHHSAQLHAYLYGLSATRDVDLDRGVVLYVSRVDLDARAVTVPFDEDFWTRRIRPWLLALTQYRRQNGIPPADPEQDWECDTCEFRIRCGQTDAPVADAGFDGFVPEHRYPHQRVMSALAANDELELTPTLAATYPNLAATNPVADWTCEACGATFAYESVEWHGGDAPTCERCARAGTFARLRGPVPDAAPLLETP
ncbi:CRISPR-associated protein Cas4 [Halanaeroarchaeum sulfurireducens]|uniref:PD-(D/E)XK endonuclease-like domain-containing protein n=1 Tax=Halanaeroarchaeum sulfurireducens TaxID=1604004 RepID=A0A0N9N9R0_9EURY|nr:PD-(D/E)XK nuclease family protein [Halanaeroarchaeum sulfurireducens]ALG81771.1 hypothetical protein HLASA_0874 [Halanaeroarchaeum sulfurireducens]